MGYPVRGEAGAWNIGDSIKNRAEKIVDFAHLPNGIS